MLVTVTELVVEAFHRTCIVPIGLMRTQVKDLEERSKKVRWCCTAAASAALLLVLLLLMLIY